MSKDSSNEDHIRAATFLEYEAIKEEQRARIGFRDNLLYATLGTYAAFFGFASQDNLMPLMFVPFVGFVLGWTYLVNDEKVSRLGKYVRCVLAARIANTEAKVAPIEQTEEAAKRVFSWELYHRNDYWRTCRKWGQCFVDVITFVIPGYVALILVWLENRPANWLMTVGILTEAFLLFVLFVTIVALNDSRSSVKLAEQNSK